MMHHTAIPSYRYALIIVLVAMVVLIIGTNMAYAGNDGGFALDLGGFDEYVVAPLDGTTLSEVTVEMWIRRTLVGTNSGIFQWADQLRAEGPFIYFNCEFSVLRLYVNGGYQMTTGVEPELWTHAAVTYDGADWRLYRNGILVATYTGGLGTYQANALNLYFGNGFAGYWNGQIDEARIWSVARTQSEIQSNMYREVTGNPGGLMAYYQFNAGTGITATDSISSVHDGTLINMEEGDWIDSTAPLGDLTAHQTGMTAMWAGQPSTVADGLATGLDIVNVSFLNDVGDDIIFAHNNAAFANVTANLPTGVEKRWNRVWELDVNDAAGTTGGNVNLTFDISDAGGQGNFGSSGTYFLLGRAAGSGDVFSIIPVVSTSVTGDQLTFTVSASNLGSEFTLGATADSPTALRLQALSAHSYGAMQMVLSLGMLLVVLSGAALIWRWRRSMQ